jgi:hypothetical protein
MSRSLLPVVIHKTGVSSINDIHASGFSGGGLQDWDISEGEPFLIANNYPIGTTTSGLLENGDFSRWPSDTGLDLEPSDWTAVTVGSGGVLRAGGNPSAPLRAVRLRTTATGGRAAIEQRTLVTGRKYRLEVTIDATASTPLSTLRFYSSTQTAPSSGFTQILGSSQPGIFGVNFEATGPFFGITTAVAGSGQTLDFTISRVRVFEYLDYLGGRPGWIGELVSDSFSGGSVQELRFRQPQDAEVVFDRESNSVLKWSVYAASWEPYRTLPQRALDYQQVFQLFDPDGIYDYYAEVLGLAYTKMMADTKGLWSLFNPDTADPEFLPHLAYTYGGISSGLTEGQLRTSIKRMLRTHRRKGLDLAIRDALLDIGYRGFANVVWVNPQNEQSYVEHPIGHYDNNVSGPFYPSSFIAVYLNELDGSYIPNFTLETKKQVAKHLKRTVLPAHTQIRYFGSSLTTTSGYASAPTADAIGLDSDFSTT